MNKSKPMATVTTYKNDRLKLAEIAGIAEYALDRQDVRSMHSSLRPAIERIYDIANAKKEVE